MKKVVCCTMCIVLIIVMAGAAFADVEIASRYTYVNSIKASLSISSGTATATGNVIPNGAMKTYVIVRLQRESSTGSWATIALWTDSNESGKSEAGGTKALTSGYNYRVYVTGKVYDSSGTVIESVNKYSSIIAY